MEFLTKLYEGDVTRATVRFVLLGDIHDLLGLARNPRMLAFIAALDEGRLRDIQAEHGQISAAELYREIIAYWLAEESKRQLHRRGLPSLDEKERLNACTTLALRSWLAASPVIGMADLSAGVSSTLGQLSERGFSTEQASHAIGSGSLLVRTDDGSFAFVHQSIMEWLVANVARTPNDPDATQILSTRPMSRLMVDFFIDLAGPERAQRWAEYALSDAGATATAKQNALAVNGRLSQTGRLEQRADRIGSVDLTAVDLRGEDLTGRDLRGADLREANLRGMKLSGIDLSNADLRGADLTGCRMVGGSIREAALAGSNWSRARLIGTKVSLSQAASIEFAVAAFVPRDRADLMISVRLARQCVAFSRDGALLAASSGSAIEIIDLSDNLPVRILQGHADSVTSVAFSGDGVLLATASGDGTARIWDTATGITRKILHGHAGSVNGVAFSADGALLATAFIDGTARIWDTATGVTRTTLQGHAGYISSVAFSAHGVLLATASRDGTARIWDPVTGITRNTLLGHVGSVSSVAFSGDGVCYWHHPHHLGRPRR